MLAWVPIQDRFEQKSESWKKIGRPDVRFNPDLPACRHAWLHERTDNYQIDYSYMIVLLHNWKHATDSKRTQLNTIKTPKPFPMDGD